MGFEASFNHAANSQNFRSVTSPPNQNMKTKIIESKQARKKVQTQARICQVEVLGMSCQSCVKNIQTNLPLKLNEVKSAKVSLKDNLATVTYFSKNGESLAAEIASQIDSLAQKFTASVHKDFGSNEVINVKLNVEVTVDTIVRIPQELVQSKGRMLM